MTAPTMATGSGIPMFCQNTPSRIAAKAEDRADREIDAAGDDDEGHRQGDQPDLRHQAALVQEVVGGQECGRIAAESTNSAAISRPPRMTSWRSTRS